MRSEITALNRAQKAKAELTDIYELGRQTAHRGDSVDSRPAYRTQNKIAAWLKGFADGKQEQEDQALKNQINQAGIAKLKSILKDVFKEK